MLLRRIGPLLLAVGIASAFKNTSPFFLLSSEPLESDAPLHSAQIATSHDVEDQLIQSLQGCDKKWYYIFTQHNVAVDDLKGGRMPRMQQRMKGIEKEGRMVQVAEVVGDGRHLDAARVMDRLEGVCSSQGKKGVDSWPEGKDEYRMMAMTMPELPTDPAARTKIVQDTDDALDDTVASVLANDNLAVLIYLTTPSSSQAFEHPEQLYEMDEPFPSALHTDLKRDLSSRQSDGSNDMQAGLPLFERYQFLSPGVFMGLTVSLLLFLILYMGITAISGLEVSYMAFSKEMGPQAQKGKQQ